MIKLGVCCGSVVFDIYNDMIIDLIVEIKSKEKIGNIWFMFVKFRYLLVS